MRVEQFPPAIERAPTEELNLLEYLRIIEKGLIALGILVELLLSTLLISPKKFVPVY